MTTLKPTRLAKALFAGIIIGLAHAGVHRLFIPWVEFVPTGSFSASIALAIVLTGVLYFTPVIGRMTSGITKVGAGIGLWLIHAVVHDGIHLLHGATLEFGEIGVPESGITVAILYAIAIIYFMMFSE